MLKQGFSENQLSRLSDFIEIKMALHFPKDRWNDLECRADKAKKKLGFGDSETFVSWLVSSPLTQEQQEVLTGEFAISETYFWREPKIFEALMNEILPVLIPAVSKGGKNLRIWSAGCATGEEPYSIAIALRDLMVKTGFCNISIMATDISQRNLRKAMTGIYGEWSFRNSPAWLRQKYFRHIDEKQYEIIPEIRKMVTFGYLNLAEDIFPSLSNNTNEMDIIFCRNVLMYFSQENIKRIGRNFFSSLVANGWLIVSGTELSDHLFPQFTAVHFPESVFYRKAGDRPDHFSARESPFSTVSELPRSAPVGMSLQSGKALLPVTEKRSDIAAHSLNQPGQGHAEHDSTTNTLKSAILSIRKLANQGRLAEALELCEKAIATNKLDPTLHFMHANIFQEQNKETEAVASLRRAIYLDRNYVLAHFTLGNILLRLGNARGARKSFENVIELLSTCKVEDTLPDSDGLTAGRLGEIVHNTIKLGE
ncbi:MAG: tetratricopeptide repeat protein [Candidatus Riflebacteria bacterium]|nr:tetratricopeptide repeat protein [Candidatus Riflebacteria bacterium]